MSIETTIASTPLIKTYVLSVKAVVRDPMLFATAIVTIEVGCKAASISLTSASTYQIGIAELTEDGADIEIDVSSFFVDSTANCGTTLALTAASGSSGSLFGSLSSSVSMNSTHVIIKQDIVSLATFSVMAANVKGFQVWKDFEVDFKECPGVSIVPTTKELTFII